MKRALIGVLVLLMLMAFPAVARDGKENLKTGFLGVEWGSSASQLTGKIEVPMSDDIPDGKVYSRKNVELGGIVIDEVQYAYYKDQFSQAMLIHNDLNELIEALRNEFGPPDMEQQGQASWVVITKPDNSEMVTIGVLPQMGRGVVVNTTYLMQMIQGADN